jgi:DNA-binding transcriptional ArsR family regulator
MNSMLLRQTPDEVICKEIESVHARRVILDQLEGGSKTGSELRESIRKDMAARVVKARGRSAKTSKVKVTDPKLYFNTKHLEDLGVITSRKDSQQRVFSLTPRAVHPVRRALGVARPIVYIASLAQPEDQRPFMQWLSKTSRYKPKKVRLFVEERSWKSGVSRDIEKFIPDGTTKRWTIDWHDIPADITQKDKGKDRGDLTATCQHIEEVIVDDIGDFDLVVDLSIGPPLLVLALTLIAQDYSLNAIYVHSYGDLKTTITSILPKE